MSPVQATQVLAVRQRLNEGASGTTLTDLPETLIQGMAFNWLKTKELRTLSQTCRPLRRCLMPLIRRQVCTLDSLEDLNNLKPNKEVKLLRFDIGCMDGTSILKVAFPNLEQVEFGPRAIAGIKRLDAMTLGVTSEYPQNITFALSVIAHMRQGVIINLCGDRINEDIVRHCQSVAFGIFLKINKQCLSCESVKRHFNPRQWICDSMIRDAYFCQRRNPHSAKNALN